MQALSDDQQLGRIEKRIDRLKDRMDRLETKMDNGFAATRAESRADFRTLVAVQLGTLATIILGFGGIAAQHFL